MHPSTSLGAALFLLILTASLPAQPSPSSYQPSPSSYQPSPSYSTRPLESVPPVVTEVEGKNMAQWKQELVNPDPSQREHAIRAVIQFGDAGSEAVPLLVSRAQDLDASPRVRALMALRMVPIQEKDFPKVIAILARRVDPYTEAQAIVRYEAAKTLAHMGEHARGAIDALRRGAKDSACWETRQMCLMVLRQIGRDPKLGADPRAVQSFLDALRDPTAKVRLEALLGLAAMGRPSDPKLLAAVQAALQSQLNNRDKSMVIWAHIGLLGLADKVPESTLKGLSNLLKNRSLEVRIQAALALGAIGTRARPLVPDLIDMLHDKEPRAILAACAALGAIGDAQDQVIATLLALAERPDLTYLPSVCATLIQLGANDPKVLDTLTRLSNRKDMDKEMKELILATIKQLKEPRQVRNR